MAIVIRPFRPTDLDILVHVATVSFAEEYTSRGITAEGFAQQVRMITKGHMIPFKLVTRLAGYTWEILVAELNGQVVGCGGYMGRKQMELVNLMVHPDYRRRGIGQALLEKRLHNLTLMGYPFVTATILDNNQASLGNVEKQGFEIFDRYTIFEVPLPFPDTATVITAKSLSRPMRPADKPVFHELEAQTATPLWLEIEGTASDSYFLGFGDRLMNRFSNSQTWIRSWTTEGKVIGFSAARTTGSETKGGLARPIIADNNLQYLPVILCETANWLSQQGKTTMQVAVPDTRPAIQEILQNSGWTPLQTWVRQVKWLYK